MDFNNTIKPVYKIDNFSIYHYGEITSTADAVKDEFFNNIKDKFVVVADNQSVGRGRGAKSWSSLGGNLFANIVIPISGDISKYSQMSFVMGLVISDIVSNITPDNTKVEVKWPNDVLVNGAKICGVLLEIVNNKLSIGVGFNVKSAPVIPDYETCCLSDLGVNVDKLEILNQLIERFNQWFDAWEKQGFDVILSMWKSRAKGIGSPIKVNLATETITGTFVDVNGDGAIVLETDAGRKLINSGEVVLV